MKSIYIKILIIAIISVSIIGIDKFIYPCSDLLGLGKSNGCEYSAGDLILPVPDEPMAIGLMVIFLVGLVSIYKLVSIYRKRK